MSKIGRALRWGLKAWLAWRLFGPEIPVTGSVPQRRPFHIPGRTVFVGERELFVREAGPEDAPPLVLLHGWSFDGEMTFHRVIPDLAKRFRVVVPDHRGHGRSDWIRGPHRIADMADDAAGVMSALGIESAYVFGYSMGGLVAQELAHRHPTRVSRLVLAATAARPIRSGPAFRVVLWLGRTVARVSRKEFSTVSTVVLRRTGGLDREHVRWMWEGLMRRDANLYYEGGRAMSKFDSSEWVGNLGIPTRVIVTTADQLMPPIAQYQLGSLVGEQHIDEIRGGRHESIMTRADEFVRLIVRFSGEEPGSE